MTREMLRMISEEERRKNEKYAEQKIGVKYVFLFLQFSFLYYKIGINKEQVFDFIGVR